MITPIGHARTSAQSTTRPISIANFNWGLILAVCSAVLFWLGAAIGVSRL